VTKKTFRVEITLVPLIKDGFVRKNTHSMNIYKNEVNIVTINNLCQLKF